MPLLKPNPPSDENKEEKMLKTLFFLGPVLLIENTLHQILHTENNRATVFSATLRQYGNNFTTLAVLFPRVF